MANDIYGDFYSPIKLLSYGKPFVISLGIRSIGKTTAFGIHVIQDFIKNGHKFVYMRRTLDELKTTAPTSFDNSVNIINHYHKRNVIESFTYEKNTYYINGEVAGYGVPLSLQQKYKSIDYSSVYWIIYDEFLPEDGRYIGGKENPFKEYDMIHSFFQTCDRGEGQAYANRVTFIFLGNNISYYNPLIIKLHADKYLRTDTKFLSPKGEKYVIEQSYGVKATEHMEESNVYALADDKRRRYAFYGTPDSKAFIGKPQGHLEPICNLIYNGEIFGTYYSEEGLVWISKSPCKGQGVRNLAITAKDHSINYNLVNTWRNSYETTIIKQAYDNAWILFENGRCRYMLNQYFMYNTI